MSLLRPGVSKQSKPNQTIISGHMKQRLTALTSLYHDCDGRKVLLLGENAFPRNQPELIIPNVAVTDFITHKVNSNKCRTNVFPYLLGT